jgi:hypothetical protein
MGRLARNLVGRGLAEIESGTRSAQYPAQPGCAAKGGESQHEGAIPVECATFATHDDTQLVATKGLSGEDRIRFCNFGNGLAAKRLRRKSLTVPKFRILIRAQL